MEDIEINEDSLFWYIIIPPNTRSYWQSCGAAKLSQVKRIASNAARGQQMGTIVKIAIGTRRRVDDMGVVSTKRLPFGKWMDK